MLWGLCVAMLFLRLLNLFNNYIYSNYSSGFVIHATHYGVLLKPVSAKKSVISTCTRSQSRTFSRVSRRASWPSLKTYTPTNLQLSSLSLRTSMYAKVIDEHPLFSLATPITPVFTAFKYVEIDYILLCYSYVYVFVFCYPYCIAQVKQQWIMATASSPCLTKDVQVGSSSRSLTSVCYAVYH